MKKVNANKPTDFTALLEGYKDKWVAVTEDKEKVISAGDNPKEVVKKARKAGYKNVSVLWATDNYGGFISGR
jgi:FMN phosphatase YigB (HAD superfamily)